MDLERWKWVGGFACGVGIGILVTVVWAQAASLGELEGRVATLEEARAGEAMRRGREENAVGMAPGSGPGAQLVADAQARLAAELAEAGPARPLGKGCEAPAQAGERVSEGGAGAVSASEWLRRQGSGS